jgi:Trypsin
VADGDRVMAIGWGAREEGTGNAAQLHQVEMAVTPMPECNRTYGGALRGGQLCAGLPEGGADACQGDSGGPLLLASTASDDDMDDVQVKQAVGLHTCAYHWLTAPCAHVGAIWLTRPLNCGMMVACRWALCHMAWVAGAPRHLACTPRCQSTVASSRN